MSSCISKPWARPCSSSFAGGCVAGPDDEAAADAVVLLARQHGEFGIVGGEAHAVGMPGQHLVGVEE
jgi:hypothetical protein